MADDFFCGTILNNFDIFSAYFAMGFYIYRRFFSKSFKCFSCDGDQE